LTELPFLAGYDYSGSAVSDHTATETGPAPHKPLEPIVLFPMAGQDASPGDKVYRHAEKAPAATETVTDSNDNWAAGSRVDDQDGALWLDVQGGWPQDLIAGGDFAKNQTGDEEPWADFREMLVTASVPWSRFAEGRYPADAELPSNDCIRRLRLRAGDDYKCDYVVPGTVLGVDAGGHLVRSSSGGVVRDCRDQLGALAQLAFAWYGQTRRALTLATSLTNSALELGMLVVSVGDPEVAGEDHIDQVNSVVTEIRLQTPLAEGTGPLEAPIPLMTWETAFGELDVLKIK
jgi:hypothetical protein